MAIVFISPVSFAEISRDPTIVGAQSNVNYVGSSLLQGLDASPGTSNISISSSGGCRFMDITGNNRLLIPFKTTREWQMFITNVKPAEVRLDLCRPFFNLSTLDGGTRIEFGSKLSTNDAGVPANMRGRVDPAGTPTAYAVDPAPLKRIDTRSLPALAAFRNATEDRARVFGMTREDCRHTVYPDGSQRDLCNPQNWIETITASFRYNLSANPVVDSDADATVNARLAPKPRDPATPENVGRWLKTLSRDATIPPFSPPPLRNCAPYTHGQRYWVDQNWQEDAIACPTGYISDPDNPYRRRYLLEREYQCFDEGTFEGAYPMPNIREKSGTSSILGACLPVVPGACNTTYTSQSFLTLNASPDLCANGTTMNGFGARADNSGWDWTCLGINTSSNASCTTSRAENATCGDSDGDVLTSAPTQNLCANGATPEVTLDGMTFRWTCPGTNGGRTADCTATKTVIVTYGWDVGDWVLGTCDATCTQSTEPRTVACPTGQTGAITEQRTLNQGGVCGSNSDWAQISNTCTPNVSNPTYCFVEGGAWHLTDYSGGTYPYGPDRGYRYYESRIGANMGEVNRVIVANTRRDKLINLFPGTVLDGTAIQSIVIGPTAHVKVWLGDNYTGQMVLDIHGPAIIYDHFARIFGGIRISGGRTTGDLRYDANYPFPALSENFTGVDGPTGLSLQDTWPQSRRFTPSITPVFNASRTALDPSAAGSSLSNWYNGSMEVTCDP